MGSSNQKGKKYQDTSKYGEMAFQVAKNNYKGGETISGSIYINMLQRFSGNRLYLKFKGKEVAHFVRLEKRGEAHVEIMYSEVNTLFKHTTPVHTFEELLPGQYLIPFSFVVPYSLSPSFYQQGHRYMASIYYRIEAFIPPESQEDPKLKIKENIFIEESLKQTQEKISKEVVTKLHTCKCCSRGTNTIKATFDKNYFVPGEQSHVFMELNNSHSNLKNEKFVFALKQRLTLLPSGRRRTRVYTKVFQALPGVKARTNSDPASLTITLPLVVNNSAMSINLKKPKKSELLRLSDNNSNVLASNTKSNLISSEYFLEVSCPMDGCCANTPKIECPISIHFPESPIPILTADIPQYFPTTIPTVNLIFPFNQQEGTIEPVEIDNKVMLANQMIYNNDNYIPSRGRSIYPNDSNGMVSQKESNL